MPQAMANSADVLVPTPVLAGNWKMYKTPDEAHSFFRLFLVLAPPVPGRTLLFFPPAISLAASLDAVRGRPDISLGVQNIHWESSGAFTGEISAPMARAAGARFVLVGHSERRHVFGESDQDVARKLAAALAADLVPVLCVGETIAQRRAGHAQAVILAQLETALQSLSNQDRQRTLIAYEPVWAIGTGENATPSDAAAAHGSLRRRLAAWLGDTKARHVPILYGGSVKPDNAGALLAADDVDGLLVGGASLDPASFAAIVHAGLE
jgi:triosephosphate isomerase